MKPGASVPGFFLWKRPSVSASKIRLLLLLVITASVGAIAVQAMQPFVRQYTNQHREQIDYGWRRLTGQWGDGSVRFVDVAAKAGLHYRWAVAGSRPIDILQGIGNGCAFLDYNGDGNLDVLLVGPKLALYQGDGKGRFTDVTAATGLDRLSGHFLGCAVGDYDNDGFDDVYISGYRTGLLLHNDGGKRFTDVTGAAGLTAQPWGTSCAFADIDGDGRLDLFVGNYVQYDPSKDQRLCATPAGPSGCGPDVYKAAHGVLYHNDGGGRFRDVTFAWGADRTAGKVLGVASVDFDESGHASLAIANDGLPTDLLRYGNGHLQNVGARSGIAFTGSVSYAGMGIDWGDYDDDGRPDMVLGTYALEAKPIYHNLGRGLFEETTGQLGFWDRPARYLTFGAKWLDYDNDGWLDVMLANGHVRDNVAAYRSEATFRQPTLLFHNDHGRRLEDTSETAGADVARPILGRGLAVGDYDNDGKVDALVVDSQGAPLLLHNESRASGHWLEITLVGVKSNRDGYGARVTAVAGGLTVTRWCHADGSYLSSSDKRVHLGLGTAATVTTLTVHWPSGAVDTWHNVRADQVMTLREGASVSSHA